MRNVNTVNQAARKFRAFALFLGLPALAGIAANAATTTTAGGPAITAVLDAGTYTPGIAEGSIFVVKGTGMSASGYTETSFPLPTIQDGVSIAFTPAAGGTPTNAYIVYLYNEGGVNQLAAVLPSTLPAGSYNVTVTNSGAVSKPFAANVVKTKIGLITQNSTGAGIAVIQNYISPGELDVDRFSVGFASGVTISPARPGQTLILWATGMGPVTGGDNVASPGVNFLTNGSGDTVQVIVGGVAITPLYAGRAPGLAGADQINFVLPSNIPTGCTVSLQVSVNSVLSNVSFLAIAPDQTSQTCVYPGLTSTQLQALDQGATLSAGAYQINQTISEVTLPTPGNNGLLATIVGGFQQYTGLQLNSVPSYQVTTAPNGACTVTTFSGTPPTPSVKPVILDAGTITLTGPSGSGMTGLALTQFSNLTYGLTITENLPGVPSNLETNNGTIVPGAYTLKGAGGKDVGPFTVSSTLGPIFTLSAELPSMINRSQPLTLSWTGGNPSDVVTIEGSTGTVTGTGANLVTSGAGFICYTTAGSGSFTIPSSVLSQMPTVSAAQITAGAGSSSISVSSGPNPVVFSPSLASGGSINIAEFSIAIGAASTPIYQ